MKKILFFATLALTSNAINAQVIKLKEKQQLTLENTVTQDMDMGMAGQFIVNSSNQMVFEVKEVNPTGYLINSKITKIKANMDGMGQSASYDSENPNDKDNDLATALAGTLHKEQSFTLDKNTGISTALQSNKDTLKEEDNANPFSASGMNKTANLSDVFFVVPANTKVGDSWQDSSEVISGAKVYKTYSLKAVENNISIVSLTSNSNATVSREEQGMQIDITLETKTTGEFSVNNQTSIIIKSNQVSDITGAMEVMGQSIPLTSKITQTIEIK